MSPQVAHTIRRIAFQRSLAHRTCTHLAEVAERGSTAISCPLCDAEGGHWVHLRMCLICGSVGCCDSSAARHARAHFEATGHPLIRSIEPGEAWRWCYLDRAYMS